ncbi:MAG: YbaB/EbfC family nucleoid-associated protein [Alphaproteobacteria bacterium]|nr:MAG: YbaB/EbfC family nucleoid-associated protein [Alphaproteobacteria bacterium]
MLKGLGSLGDMARLMKQAQEMQEKMAEVQERLEALEVEGSAGAGLVRAWVTAKGAVRRISIDPSLFSAEEREVVEDLVVAALREAQEKAAEVAAEEMSRLTAGLPLPPGVKLPF